MNTLEMTDDELYEMGVKILTDKLGASEVPRFTRQGKPGKGNYSVDRHKLLENQPRQKVRRPSKRNPKDDGY